MLPEWPFFDVVDELDGGEIHVAVFVVSNEFDICDFVGRRSGFKRALNW